MHMSNESSSAAYPEVTFHHAPADSDSTVKKIVRTTVILSVITLIELALGFTIYYLHKSPDYSHALVSIYKRCHYHFVTGQSVLYR